MHTCTHMNACMHMHTRAHERMHACMHVHTHQNHAYQEPKSTRTKTLCPAEPAQTPSPCLLQSPPVHVASFLGSSNPGRSLLPRTFPSCEIQPESSDVTASQKDPRTQAKAGTPPWLDGCVSHSRSSESSHLSYKLIIFWTLITTTTTPWQLENLPGASSHPLLFLEGRGH